MLFSPFERLVAMRYLRARRQGGAVSLIAAFSFLGIALGVATLIIVMSVMNGFRAQLIERIMGINAHAVVRAMDGPLRDARPVLERLRAAPGVVLAMPVVEAQALVTAQGRATGVRVRGLAPGDFARRPVVGTSVVRGLPDLGTEGVAIGIGLSRQLGVGVGGEITLVSPRGTPTPFGTVPRRRAYPVVAVFDVQMPEYDQGLVYMPLEAAQTFFRLGNAVSAVDVFVERPLDARALRAVVDPLADEGLRVLDWRQANASYVTALGVERVAMFVVLTLIILVAAFNIVSSLIMLVRDKGSAIAILRTMGAGRRSILKVFLLAGGSIGVVGTLGGILGLGLWVTHNIATVGVWLSALTGAGGPSFLDGMTALIDWGEVALVVAMGLGLSLAATVYPAWRAAKTDPVEALRYG